MKIMEFWVKETYYHLKQNKHAFLGFIIVVVFLFIAIFAPLLAPHSPSLIHDGQYRIPPFWNDGYSWKFLLGTDDVGRDFLSRLIYGTRISLGIGFFSVFFSLTIGSSLGLLAGYWGGWVDTLIMRLVDIMMSIPSILLAIVVVAILGPDLFNTIIAVGIVACPAFIRLVRASVIGEKNKQYVVASRVIGASHFRQAVINILPNCLAPMIVQSTFGFSEGILSAAGLGFLGLGAQPPIAEWGTMLSDGRAFIESNPWLVTLPGVCILLVVFGFNLLGDGLRDILDPKETR